MKPELAAPGVNILSSVFEDGFALFSGTSMAAPHVTGAAALLLEEHPEWSPAEVKAALVNGADSIDDPTTGEPYQPAEAGNGRLNVYASDHLPFLVSPPTASFGYHNVGGRSAVASLDLTVIPQDGSMTCTVDADPALNVSDPSFSTSDPYTFTVSLADRSGRAGDAQGFFDVSCDGTTVRVPWGSYTRPPSRPAR